MDKTKKKRIYIAILLLALVTVAAVSTAVYAKYVDNKEYVDNQVKAKNFYFTTDLFDSNEDITRDIHVRGVADIPFSVMNYFDDIRISDSTIDYKITLKSSEGVSGFALLDETLTKITLDSDNTTEEKTMSSKAAHKYYLKIDDNTVFKNNDTIAIEIKTTGDSLYSKTMTLNFILHDYEYDILYYYEDKQNYTKLIVTSNVTVSPEDILIDWSSINASGNVFQVDTTSSYLLNSTNDGLATCNETSDYLEECYVTKEISSMQSFAIIFYKVPSDDTTFYCQDYKETNPKGVNPTTGESYKYKIEIKLRGAAE